jgi:hypothetical protein
MLTAAQQRARASVTVHASCIPILMSGDGERINQYFCEATGQKQPEDLRWKWAPYQGSALEIPIIDFHEHKTQMEHTMRGVFYRHPEFDYVGATIDTYRPHDDCVVEVKVCSGWQRLDDIVAYYTGQVICQMRCVSCEHGALLVCHGGAEPVEIPIIPDPAYEREMWTRAAAFQLCVKTLTPPSPIPVIVPPEEMRSLDLRALPAIQWPNWAHHVCFNLEIWRDVRPAADQLDETIARIKALIPDDVREVKYDDVIIIRNRRGAMTIRHAG